MLQNLSIKFYLNDKCVQIAVAPATTALQLLREQLAMTGAKEVCTEGDCGACTVALGQWQNGEFKYRAINSCLLPAARLHGCHVITVEGLAATEKLHVIQSMMLEKHAVQCGYCTSGMIMALFCLFANNPNPEHEDILAALEGNICRCTGYQAIYTAAKSVTEYLHDHKGNVNEHIFPTYVATIQKQLENFDDVKIVTTEIPAQVFDKLLGYYVPQNLADLWQLITQHANTCKLINGGSDLMVLANIHKKMPKHFIDISNISELKFIRQEKNEIVIGGAVTLTEILQSAIIKEKMPTLHYALTRMASTQIRNVATLAGNIANASPIADGATVLLALDAKLHLKSATAERVIALGECYIDYKLIQLRDDEIIYSISIPCEQGFCHFEKSAKRSVLDIATVNSAVNVITDENNIVIAARIAFGGVAKYPALACAAGNYLLGKKITADVVTQLAQIAQDEFAPISDIRGSADFRHQLIYNHIIKHFSQK